MPYAPKTYRSNNGDKINVASGGTLDAVAGSTVNLLGTVAMKRPVEAHAAGDTLTAAETGSVHTNTGASGTITLVLPPATVGLEFFFGVGAAQALRLDPDGTETISLPSTGVPGAAGKYLWADAVGESVHLLCTVAGSWTVMGYTGTWTAEP